jgi:hypothetical protein
MSNHFSADKLKFPGDDRRLDLTDVFVFRRPPAATTTTPCCTGTTPARPC